MSKRILSLLCLVVASGLGHAANPCVETGPNYGPWSCLQQGTLNSAGSLSSTSIVVCVGETVVGPTSYGTIFNNGKKTRSVTFVCPENANYTETNTVVYVAGDTYFQNAAGNPMPTSFTTPGTYSYTARIDGVPVGGVCSGISNIVLGTFTVYVWALTDSDYDGFCDCQEAKDGTDPYSGGQVTEMWLGYWSFNNTNWTGEFGQSPLVHTNLELVAGCNYDAVRINSPTTARLSYRDIETNGWANINVRQGTIRFWFRPNWASTNKGGTGPQSEARLIEIGDESGGSPTGWWAVILNSTGTQLRFVTQTNGTGRTNLTGTISWNSEEWHQIAITYSASNSALYVDGQAVNTNGLGVLHYPGPTVRSQGFSVGSDKNGNRQAKGRFDDLETYNYVQSRQTISNVHAWRASQMASSTLNLNSCILRPITLRHSMISTVAVNASFTMDRGTGPGNFSWVEGKKSDKTTPRTLAIQLTNETGFAYIESENASDNIVSVGDWIAGVPGNKKSSHVRESLNWLITNQVPIVLPVWSTHRGPGANLEYQVTNYAQVRLLSYGQLDENNLNKSSTTFTFLYLGSTVCETRTNTAPQVNAGPDQLICFGSSAALNGAATDDGLPVPPSLNFAWTKLSGPGTVNFVNQNATNTSATFTLPGVYRLQLLAADGELTGVDTLDIIVQTNTAATGPSSQTVCPGATVIFSTTPSGTPPFSFVWRKNGAILSGQTSSSLTLANVTAASAGTYSVQVNGACGSVTNSATLAVNLSTTATGPTNLVRDVGQTATFSTVASGTGPFTYVWRKDGIIIAGQTASTLVRSNLTFADRGIYSVRVNGACNSVTNNATLVVRVPPTVNILTPTNTQVFVARANIRLTSIAEDLDGIVTNVSYYANSNFIGRATQSPYPFVWTNVTGGTYTLTAVATDNDGKTATSPAVQITVLKQPPTVVITNPAPNSVFASGAPVLIQANAQDADGIVTNVQFFASTTLLGNDTTSPYSYNWLTAPSGTNLLKAVAVDNDGLFATSSIVAIIVEGCPTASSLTNFVLSTTNVPGGSVLTGTVQLASAAIRGGQAINLWYTNDAVILPGSVLVPEGQTSLSFPIWTKSIIDTISVQISAGFGTASFTNTLQIIGGTGEVSGGTNQTHLQITADTNTAPPLTLVRSILGSGVDLYEDSIVFRGVNASAGLFTGGTTVLGFESGLVLSSGNITNLTGTNLVTGATLEIGTGSDTDLDTLTDDGTHDSTVLEFGFIPETDVLIWEYVFASEEYDEYVGGNVNDVFGFFINGTNVALLPDGSAVAIDNVNFAANTNVYRDNRLGDEGFGFGTVGPYETEMDGLTTVLRVLAHVNPGVSNHVKLAIADAGDPFLDSVVMIRAGSVRSAGGVIHTRDDLVHTNYLGITMTGSSRFGADTNAVFDVKSIDGAVLGARMERAGTVEFSGGNRFDLQWGARYYGLAAAFAPAQSNAHLKPSPFSYQTAWTLPRDYHSTLESQFGGFYPLQLVDQISSLCGSNQIVLDRPYGSWPTNKNIFTFMTSGRRAIAQGRCMDLVLDGTNGPLNGSWDIIQDGEIVASSGQPNGWSVEADYTVYGGINVCAPTNALIVPGYEARLRDGSSSRSAVFSVVTRGSINSAPVMFPLVSSTNVANGSATVIVTVRLDAPAPGGNAYVSLTTEGSSNATVPPYVVIPAGGRTATFSYTTQPLSTNSTFAIKASFNGYRKSPVRILAVAGSPPVAPSITATGGLGIVSVNWSSVAGATSYILKRSTNSATGYTEIFNGLTSTSFVDTHPVQGVTNYYRVLAVNDYGRSPDSAPAGAKPLALGIAARPRIIPGGGTFNDFVAVRLETTTPNAQIRYTTNNSIPDTSSTLYNGSNLFLSNSVTLRARAFRGDLDPSPVALASFVIVKPADLTCGANTSGALTPTNAWSIVDGPGYFSARYALNKTAGHEVDISVTSTEFDTVLYLMEPSGAVVAANDDASPSNSNSRIVFTLRTNGVHIIEVTSFDFEEIGNFNLSVTCRTNASIHLFTNNVALANYGIFDFGTITGGVTSSSIVVSNLGLGPLTLNNIAVYPANLFSVTPSSVATIQPNQRTNLQLQFGTGLGGTWTGLLVITNNVASENPFYVNLRGRVIPPPGPPNVSIIFPTNGTIVPFSPVNIELHASASDADGITNVAFYRVGVPTPLGSTTNAPYSIWWSNVTSGTYTLEAKAWDGAGFTSVSPQIVITVGAPSITLSPSNACVGISNTTHTVTAFVTNAAGAAVAGTPVTFSILGAQSTNAVVNTDSSGRAIFTYTGKSAGVDRISASATVNSTLVTAGPVTKPWARLLTCGTEIPGSLDTSDAISIGCNCPNPARYSDYYSITGLAGDIVRFTMKSTNFSTFMFLMATNCAGHTVTNEALNANDTQIRFTLPTNGTYILETTSYEVFQTGNYSVRLDCGAVTGPEIAMLVSGTNTPSFTTIDFGSTTNGTAVSRSITLTNRGTATLSLNSYFFTLSNVFSITPPPVTNLAVGAAATFNIQFLTTNSGQYLGSLVITNNDSDENPFVVHLSAISNPNGAPPTIVINTPTNNSRFVLPGGIEITATATPIGTGVTITNVDFGFRNSSGTFFIGADTISPFTVSWAPPEPGTYTLIARAWDSQGRVTVSAGVTVEFYPSTENRPPVANTDRPTVLANSINNVIDVLANDTDPDNDALTIIAIAPPNVPVHGTSEIINNGKAIRYTPVPNIRGYPADGFSYQISDGKGGTAWGGVLVTVDASDMPFVQIIAPPNGHPTNAGSLVNIRAEVTPSANIVKVEFYRGLEKIGEVTNGVNGVYTLEWIADTESENCDCAFTATAVDKFGQMGTSSPITINVNVPPGVDPPVAMFDNLNPLTENLGGMSFTHMATITEGLFDLYGRAYHPQGSNVTWSLRVHDLEGNLVADFTPPPLNNIGFHIGAAGSPTTSNLLATCDFTLIRNGIYDITLMVRGGFRSAKDTVRFRLESDLKIGQFTFTEQDSAIPVSGIPLVVTRTYDSRNPRKGDFGVGWTYSVTDLEIQLDEERMPAEDIYGEDFSLRTGGGRNMLITLPGGRRAVFAFYWEEVQCNAGDRGSFCLSPRWKSPPGLGATLEVIGEHRYTPVFDRWMENGNTSFEWYEFPGWVLTLRDGTRIIIGRDKEGEFFMDDPPDQPLTAGNIFAITYRPPYVSKIVQRSGDTIEIERDFFGRSNRILHKDANGNPTRAIVFERDNQGRIIAISDPMGQDASGQPTGHRAVKYDYDGAGNLSKVLKLVNRSTGAYLTNQYFYENARFPNYITRIVNARSKPALRNLYDDMGRLIGIVDATGRTNRFEHDVANRREVHYSRFGDPTVYQYDANGRVLSVTDPLGHTNGFTYNESGYQLTMTDSLGNTTWFTNNADGDILAVVLPYPPGADPAVYTTSFTYSPDGNRTSTRLPTGAVITNEFDANGKITAVKDVQNNVIASTVYNSLGLPQKESDPFSSLGYKYDALGNLTHVTNTHNQVVVSGYDANGNITNLLEQGVTRSVAYDALNRQTSANFGNGMSANYGYDADGSWSSVNGPTLPTIQRSLDERGQLSDWTVGNRSQLSYGFNAEGQVEYLTNAIGAVTHTMYDAAGRMIGTKNLTTGAEIGYSYDAVGRNTAVTNPLGYTVRIAYNADNSVSSVTNELDRVWFYSYDTGGACCGGGSTTVTATDPLGRQLTELRSAYGLPISTIWRSGLQVSSNHVEYLAGLTTPQQEAEEYPTVITDEGGRKRRFDYTALGQLFRSTDLSGSTWWTNQYHSGNGTLTNVHGPTGETLSYSYDERENLKTIRFGDGNYLTNYFNAENRLASNALPSGVKVFYQYNSTGKLTNRSSTLGESASYQYNNLDSVTIMGDSTGSTTNRYDAAGRLIGIDYPSGATVRFAVDVLGRITAITNKTTSAGTAYVTKYEYDATGNITNVTDPFNGRTRFEFDRVGRRTKRVLPNDVVTEWQYDWRDRVTNIVHLNSSGVLASFAYVRNAGGDASRITREDGSYVELQYDSALRLTNEVYRTSGGLLIEQISYGYDIAGSRTRLVKGGVIMTNSVSAGYRTTAVKNAANGATLETYAYDNGGRVTTIGRDGGTLNLTYTAADKIDAATNGANWVTYRYDASGRRTVSTNSAGVVRRFVVAVTPATGLESPHMVANAAGTLQQGYIYMGDEPLLRFDAVGNRVYYLEDAMGSVAALADDGGTKIASFNYDGFGNIRNQTGTVAVPAGTGGDFRFHRGWLESDTGLYHKRAREYDPRTGRFVSRDPRNGVIQRPETLHPYVFAVNNPFLYADPTGEFTVIEINVTQLINSSLQALKQTVVNAIKNKVKDSLFQAISNLVVDQLSVIYPPLGEVWAVLKEKGGKYAGDFLEDQLIKKVCEATGMASFLEYVYFFPGIREADGKAVFNGFGCGNLSLPSLVGGNRYPDFIISEVGPEETAKPNSGEKAILVGDIKLSGNSLYNKYIDKNNKHYDGPGQFDAMTRFAGQYTYTRVTLFLTAFTGQKSKLLQVRLLLQGDALKDGVIVFVVAAAKNKNFDDVPD